MILHIPLIIFILAGIQCAAESLACWTQLPHQQTISSERLIFNGSIHAENGSPVTDAKLWLSPVQLFDVTICRELWDELPVLQSSPSLNGNFQFELTRDSPVFGNRDYQLVIYSPKHEIYSQIIPATRMRVDVPMSITLRPSCTIDLHVEDPEGNPLFGARVVPSNVSGGPLPYVVSWQLPVATCDETGVATLRNTSISLLQSTYVQHDDFGNQRIPIETVIGDDGKKKNVIRVKRCGPLSGKFVISDDHEVPASEKNDFSKIRALLMCSEAGVGIPGNANAWVSFANADVNDERMFEIDRMGYGAIRYQLSCPEDFPYRETHFQSGYRFDANSNGACQFKLVRRPRIVVSIFDGKEKQPLEGIYLELFDGRLESISTDSNGKAGYYGIFEGSSYYTYDPLGKYFSASNFMESVNQTAINGRIECDPHLLAKAFDGRGKVVDEMGTAVAGASIEYSYSRERFLISRTAYSNRDGTFQFEDCTAGTVVQIRAGLADMASESHQITLGEDNIPTIVLKKRRSLRPAGMVDDQDGMPINGVKVTLKQGHVVAEESYDRLRIIPQDFYPANSTTITNVSGQFVFPATIKLDGYVQIEINDPAYLPFYSPMYEAGRLIAKAEQLDLGKFELTKRPIARTRTVHVVDNNGNGLANARVVLVGAHLGRHRGVTDQTGQINISIGDGVAVYAIESSDGNYSFGQTVIDGNTIELKFDENYSNYNSVATIKENQIEDCRNWLMQSLPRPNLDNTTSHRKAMYVYALAHANPEEYSRLWQEAIENNSPVAETCKDYCTFFIRNSPESATENWINSINATNRFWINEYAARATGDPAVREECLSEAMVAARSEQGETRQRNLAELATTFNFAGQHEMARKIAREIWETDLQFEKQLANNEYRESIAFSRGVAPVLALYDLEKAAKLIDLTALKSEVHELQCCALLHWANANPAAFRELLSSGECSFIDLAAGIEPVYWTQNATFQRDWLDLDMSNCSLILNMVKDPGRRIDTIAIFANCASAEQKVVLFKQLRDAFAEFENSPHHEFLLWQGNLFDSLLGRPTWSEHQKQVLAFDALWYLPEQFATKESMRYYGAAAKIIAFQDRNLTRLMLEPKVDYRGWFFEHYYSVQYLRDPVIGASLWADPDWALSVIQQLSENELNHYVPNQLEIRACFAEQLSILEQHLFGNRK
jgi:hypothetical protein